MGILTNRLEVIQKLGVLLRVFGKKVEEIFGDYHTILRRRNHGKDSGNSQICFDEGN
jgi:hypothetical protein